MEVTIPWNAYTIAQFSLLSHPPNLSNSSFSIPAFLVSVRRTHTAKPQCPLHEVTRSEIRKTGSEVTWSGEKKTESQKIRPSHFHPRKRPASQRRASPGPSSPPGSTPCSSAATILLSAPTTPLSHFPSVPNIRNPGFWSPGSGPVGLLEPSRPTSLPSLRSPRTTPHSNPRFTSAKSPPRRSSP